MASVGGLRCHTEGLQCSRPRGTRPQLPVLALAALLAACAAHGGGLQAALGFSAGWSPSWCQVRPRSRPPDGQRKGQLAAYAAKPEVPVLVAERDEAGESDGRGGKNKAAIQPMSWLQKPKPPTLPANLFRPKESLSQTFLADPNYIFKMVNAINDDSPAGKRVIELGPGTGAVTSRLWQRYPEMVGIELDQRAMRVLAQNVPGATVIRSDVLLVNYTRLAEVRGGKLSIVGNTPFHVTSQILFTLADHARSIRTAHVIMQKEVAERVVAKPNSKKYGIPSVVFQLYADPQILFHMPPTCFFPRPNVMSSYVKLDFEAAEERLLALNVDPRDLRNLTNTVFKYRRKMMRNSLMRILSCHHTLIDELPEEYAKLRPEQIEPWEFVHLTQLIFGKKEFPKHLRRAWRGEFGRTVRED